MSAGAEHINITLVHINGNLCERLHCVRMEQDTVLPGDLSNLCDRLDGADLIVCEHHGDQDRIRAERCLHILRIYKSVLIHIQIRHLISALFKIFAGMEDRMMFDPAGDDMFSL